MKYKPKGLVLSIDFDQVIHNKAEPLEGRKMGPPMPGAVEAMEQLYDSGHKLIVHTTMARTEGGTKAVEDWLDFYGVDYHEVTALKPVASWYLDDKALRFTAWDKALTDLQEHGVQLLEDED